VKIAGQLPYLAVGVTGLIITILLVSGPLRLAAGAALCALLAFAALSGRHR
jgi:hypothetical protein